MTANGERHRALALLARGPNGRTETFMLLHGCTRQQLDGLIRVPFEYGHLINLYRGFDSFGRWRRTQ